MVDKLGFPPSPPSQEEKKKGRKGGGGGRGVPENVLCESVLLPLLRVCVSARKLYEITQILDMKMKKIVERYVEGGFGGVGGEEVVGLLRALFCESGLREEQIGIVVRFEKRKKAKK